MGYNVFSLPLYARVYYSGMGCEGKFYKIRDKHSNVGLRDRDNLVVPVEYANIEDYYIHWRGNLYDCHITVTNKDGSKFIWQCLDHLELNNQVTRHFIKGCKDCLNNYSWISREYLDKYMKYVSSNNDDIEMRKALEDCFVYYLNRKNDNRTYEDRLELHSIADVRKSNKIIESDDFIYSVSMCADYFSYLDSPDFTRLLLDTLYDNCKLYKVTVKYSETAKYRLLAKDYEKAVTDAEKAITNGEPNANVMLAEALYFYKEYDKAFDIIDKRRWEKVGDDYSYLYFGDLVLRDFIEYQNKNVLQDTISERYSQLKELLKVECDRYPYSYIAYMNSISFAHDNDYDLNQDVFWHELYEKNELDLCVSQGFDDYLGVDCFYIIKDGIKTSPVFNCFAYSFDEPILLIVDTLDAKRKYLYIENSEVSLLSGTYDHAWRFSEGMAAVVYNDLVGFIDNKGAFIIAPKFSLPHYDKPGYIRTSHTEGLKKYNIWSTAKCVDFIFQNGLCPMSGDNGLFGFINKRGEWVVEPEYSYIGTLKDGYRIVRKEDKYGIMDANLKLVVPVEFNRIDHDMRSAIFDIDNVLYDYSELSELQEL